MYDAIVVGARCAGSPTAMLLGPRGLPRADARPRRIPLRHPVHARHPPARRRRARPLGTAGPRTPSGCPPLDQAVYEVADIRLEGCSPGWRASAPDTHRAATSWTPSWWTRPSRPAPSSATAARSPTWCATTPAVSSACRAPTAAAGSTERARLVIGADGMRSTVASISGARVTAQDPRLTCAYYAYWEDVPAASSCTSGREAGWRPCRPTTVRPSSSPTSRSPASTRSVPTPTAPTWNRCAPRRLPCSNGFRASAASSDCAAPATSRTSSDRRSVPAGHWSAMPDTTRTPSPLAGSATRSSRRRTLVRHIGDRLGDPDQLDPATPVVRPGAGRRTTRGYEATLAVAQLTTTEQRLSAAARSAVRPGAHRDLLRHRCRSPARDRALCPAVAGAAVTRPHRPRDRGPGHQRAGHKGSASTDRRTNPNDFDTHGCLTYTNIGDQVDGANDRAELYVIKWTGGDSTVDAYH